MGLRSWSDVVMVTDIVTHNVDNNVVCPLTVCSHDILSVLPLDISMNTGVQSMFSKNDACQFGPTIFGHANLMKSRVSLASCSGGRWHLCETVQRTILFETKNCLIAQSFDLFVFVWNAVLSSQALRVNNQTETMKPCSQGNKPSKQFFLQGKNNWIPANVNRPAICGLWVSYAFLRLAPLSPTSPSSIYFAGKDCTPIFTLTSTSPTSSSNPTTPTSTSYKDTMSLGLTFHVVVANEFSERTCTCRTPTGQRSASHVTTTSSSCTIKQRWRV